jgi:cobalt/nickel transport system permease protein
MIITGLSRLPLIYIFKRLFIVLPVIVLAAAFYPLSILIAEGSNNFSMQHQSVTIAASIFFKAILSVLFLILLVSTEKFHNLLSGLRKIRMPTVICIIAALMYRYVFILADESMKTTLARQSRTPGTLRMSKWKVLGNQMAVVFLRSWERSKIIYGAMQSRGFSGNFYSMNDRHMKASDIVIFCIFGILFLSVRFRNEIGIVF